MPDVGWRLAEEIAWARPERPGPEWWTLMDIAQDARDETRQSMCGQDYLMARGKCSKRTLYRRLDALRSAKMLIVARQSAPGVRAIYEIPVIHRAPGTGVTIAGTRSPVDNQATGVTIAGTRSEVDGCQNGGQRVPLSRATGATIAGTHAVTNAVTTTPSTSIGTVNGASVEGGGLSTGVPSARMSPTEKASWQAAESRARRNTIEGIQ